MPLQNISLEIHSHSPELIKQDPYPKYRIYVDQELIVERKWVWNNDIAIQEHLIVDVPYGPHTITLYPIINENPYSIFKMTNIFVNQVEARKVVSSEYQVSFQA